MLFPIYTGSAPLTPHSLSPVPRVLRSAHCLHSRHLLRTSPLRIRSPAPANASLQLSGLRMDAGAFFIYFLIIYTNTLATTALFRLIGSLFAAFNAASAGESFM